MAITYTWQIPQLDCMPSKDGLTNVVKTVHWRLVGTDGTYNSLSYGSQAFPRPDSADFIPYEDLTEEIVASWVESSLKDQGLWESVSGGIARRIEEQKNPPIVTPQVPWG